MQSKQGSAGAGHVLDLKKVHMHGERLFATNEPRVEAGTATDDEKRLAAMFSGGAPAMHLTVETATEYAERRARERDRRALEQQVNDPLVR